MALQAQTRVRVFKYNAITLVDPDPTKTPAEIMSIYARQYPELLNSVVEGPVTKGGQVHYTFTRAVGHKG